VDKGAPATSFDVVAIVRRRLGERRIGHAGTLDPDATGVLPVLVGEATKLTPYLVDHEKEYLATVRFGLTTDTHDVSGRVLSETPVGEIARDRLADVCRGLVGRIKQVPPMYSAIHHEGRRLYELARAGIEVARAPHRDGAGRLARRSSRRPERRAVHPWAGGRRRAAGGGRGQPRASARRRRTGDRSRRIDRGREQGQARAHPACGSFRDSSPTSLSRSRPWSRWAPSMASTSVTRPFSVPR